MKIAISVPDEAHQRIEASAHQAGMSPSAFYTRAALALTESLDSRAVTAALDAALAHESADDTNAVAAALGRATLSDERW